MRSVKKTGYLMSDDDIGETMSDDDIDETLWLLLLILQQKLQFVVNYRKMNECMNEGAWTR